MIILVVLGLLVLVVLAVILGRNMGVFSKETSDCASRNGICVSGSCSVGQAVRANKPILLKSARCPDPGDVCCIG